MQKDPAARYQTAEELAQELGDVRAGKTAQIPAATPARTFSPIGDTDATLIEPVRVMPEAALPDAAAPVAASLTAQTAQAATHASIPATHPAAAAAKKSNPLPILGAVAAVVIVGGGAWFAMHSNKMAQPSSAENTPAVPAAIVATAGPAPAAAIPSQPPLPSTSGAAPAATATVTSKTSAPAAPSPAKPSPGTPAKSTPTTTPARNAGSALTSFVKNAATNISNALQPKGATAAPAGAPTAPVAGALGFDPATLDPKTNAKLKVDAEGMPPGLQFTVEMNGHAYSHGTHGTNVESFVPPGSHELRVTASQGSVQKTSNAVSLDFQPKKRYTLRVELHIQGKPASAGRPDGLYPDSQIVVSLK
jgi:hypothetical protein